MIPSPGYAEVAVGLPVPTTFHYRIPSRLKGKTAVGKRIWVPFRNRQLLGFVVGLVDKSDVPRVRAIEQVVDEQPILEPEILTLTRWMAKTTQCSWGEAIQTALPGPLRRGKTAMEPRVEEPPQEFPPTVALSLTEEQRRAVGAILQAVETHRHQVFLLHGITGSGKTEVYLQAIQGVVDQGRGSIVLVPEISLTPQTVERFKGRFGQKRVAILHSALLESQRLKEWRRIRSGEVQVVVGARSAIFAPLRELGLIVVDEEQETSYKQEDSPRYHAREVAIHRGELARAPVILGSATPSLESFTRAKTGAYRLLTLSERIDQVPLPQVEVIDMRQELGRGRRGRIFSRTLEEALAETLSQRQQAILFLNRRGFSTIVQCRKCGFLLRCKSCRVSLTYHIASRQMICHTCHAKTEPPEICPQCRSDYVRFQGLGTERVESELARIFPQASIARMDTDATSVRGSHARILGDFQEHKIDFLIGTQMVAKGLDFPRVTLVGVISADTALNLPDFRSAERTFQLLTQVAGRAGRGALPGRVIIQTYAPHHYAIQAASRHDYIGFYAQETAIRKELGLPPFSRLVRLTVRSLREGSSFEAADRIARACRQQLPPSIEILGPAPANPYRLRRSVRWQILLKSPTLDQIPENLATRLLKKSRLPKGCAMAIDVDPL